MNDDPLRDPPASGAPPRATTLPATGTRLWAERIGIGLLVSAALMVPLLAGLAYYLILNDGLLLNGNDPLREARLWMIQERRGFTGLALSIASPATQTEGEARCARTQVTFIKWEGSIRLEPQATYCQCFVRENGQWIGTPSACQP